MQGALILQEFHANRDVAPWIHFHIFRAPSKQAPGIAGIIGVNGLVMVVVVKDCGNCDKNWTVLSSISSDYYVGIKLSINDTVKIGWLLLDINTNNGKISVLDSKLSTASEIIIE